MSIMELRKKRQNTYAEDELAFHIPPTSEWKQIHVDKFNIKVYNLDKFPYLDNKLEVLEIIEWQTPEWLNTCDVSKLKLSNNSDINRAVQTLIVKIKKIYNLKGNINEFYVDGFMNTLLALIGFDLYPCEYFPQYQMSIVLGEDDEVVNSRLDYGIFSETKDSIAIIVEDKTMSNATVGNKWKESQVLGEIFVALHYKKYKKVYAVRIVANLFTFYVSEISDVCRIANLSGKYGKEEIEVGRYPEINFNDENLKALDFYFYKDRIKILEHLSFIYNDLIE